MDKRSKRLLLEEEIIDYTKRLEYAVRYDNLGERLFLQEMIERNKIKLEALERDA